MLLTYVQIVLAVLETLAAGAALWQLKGGRDPLWIPLGVVLVAAGMMVPSRWPIGHSTVVSLGLQALAVVVLLGIARAGHRRAAGGR